MVELGRQIIYNGKLNYLGKLDNLIMIFEEAKMKKIILTLVTAIAFFQTGVISAATYSGGSGTSDAPYLISTPADINTLGGTSGDWSKYFKLVADINMADYTGTEYKIIGNATTKFTGTFDGNDCVISNLTYAATAATSYVGLFGYALNATIKNLGVEDVNISGKCAIVGALIGYQNNSNVTNCYSTGIVGSTLTSSTIAYAGGLIGYQSDGNATNCYSTASVTASSSSASAYTGGLIGYQGSSGIAENCYSAGFSICSSTNYSSFAGGLIGYQYSGTAKNCYSTRWVSSTSSSSSYYAYAGGLTARQYNTANATIENCYAAGWIYTSATNCYEGGFVGHYGGSGTISNCFWDTDISCVSDGLGYGTSTEVVGKTSTKMKTSATFTDVGWDFDDVWEIHELQTYPLLKKYNICDLNHDKIVNILDFAIFAENWLD